MINFSKMSVFLLSLMCLFTFCSIAKELPVSEQVSQDADYLSELKEQLELTWPDNKTINIVFHGHSVPSGYFRTPTVNTLDAYPHLFLKFIKKKYKTAVVNCITTSIGGEQAEQGAARFSNDVLPMKPDLLFVDYALNDRSIGVERAEKAWRSMIEAALANNLKLVLLTPTPDLKENIMDEDTPLAKHTEMIKKLGNEYEIPVVDVYAKFKRLKSEGADLTDYMSQGNHPNEKGHQVAFNAIVEELF